MDYTIANSSTSQPSKQQTASEFAIGKSEETTITFEPKKVAVFLGVIIICLSLANFAGIFSKFYLGSSRIALFELDREANIPTLYSSVTILICAGLLAMIASARKRLQKRDYLYWVGLAIVFLFLSADETAGIHERMISPLRSALHTSGILYFAWVIPYGILLIGMMVIYFRFLFTLPVRFRYLIIFAAILYIGGALGGELLGGYWTERYGQENITYTLITTCEESLEMVGILVFTYTLMSYIASELKDLFIHIGSGLSAPKPGLK
jgi:hypothetical protein